MVRGKTGWCNAHYQRVLKHGDPQEWKPIREVGVPIAERFWMKVDQRNPAGCWIWTAAVIKATGYGRFGIGSNVESAHRVAYELTHGPIPAGLHIDHLCRNRACVNPAHLEAVTQAENNRRAPESFMSGAAYNRAKTHCPKGHPYDAENTYLHAGHRHCRACGREASKRYDRKQRHSRR